MRSFVAATLIGAAAAAAHTTTVVVGGPSAALVYTPAEVTGLARGDKVVFQFQQLNHSIIQTTFDSPCVAQNNPSFFHSGFVRTANVGNQTASTFEITISDPNTPIWYYCGQGPHCARGMVGSINANPESPRNLEAFRAAAANVAVESISIPNPPDVRNGLLTQGDKADVLVPGPPKDQATTTSPPHAGATQTVVVIQTSIQVITVTNGATSTIGTTDITYATDKPTTTGVQVTWLSAQVTDGTTSFSTAWAVPTAGAQLATTSTIVASAIEDGADSGAAALATGRGVAAYGLLSMLVGALFLA